MSTSNGSTNGHSTDEAIDVLYSFFPGATPAPQPCPEALFSLTLRGTLDGVETLLTVRGMTSEEFKANLQQVRGLLDCSPAPTISTQSGAAQSTATQCCGDAPPSHGLLSRP
jgi:hypothetical protein